MKKTLVLFPLLLSLTAFANHDADAQTGSNFVEKGFVASNHKCQKVQSDVESWEANKEDCLFLKEMMALRAARAAEKTADLIIKNMPEVELASEAPVIEAELPKDEI